MKRERFLLMLEIALVLVYAAMTFSIQRLFHRPDFTIVWCYVFALPLALGFARRLRRGGAIALGVIVVGALWIAVAPGHLDTFAGPFPTLETWRTVTEEIRKEFAPFRSLVPPVPFGPGFRFAILAVFTVIIPFADAAVLRARAAVQGVIPVLLGFILTSYLARGTQETASGMLMAGALVILAGTNHINTLSVLPWSQRELSRAHRSWLLWGCGFAAVSLFGAIIARPMLTDLAQPRAVDLISVGRGAGTRIIPSPFVSLNAQLGPQRETEMFTVRSEQPHYWRLTALDSFNGDTWSSENSYEDIDDDLSGTTPPPDGVLEAHQFQIKSLASDWVPAAFSPVGVANSSIDMRYHAASGSILASERNEVLDGETYKVTSAIPAPGAARLRADQASISDQTSNTALPDTARSQVEDITHDLTREATTDYDKLLAIQAFLRQGTYDRSAQYSGALALRDFLQQLNGFCQQYASAFAAMARSMGIPARVAIGFTYGTQDADGNWVIRGRNAHAWPEVYFQRAGWISFEPTPSRGNPDATQYTGIGPDQDPGTDEPTATSTSTSAPTTVPSTVASTQGPATSATSSAPPSEAEDSESSFPAFWIGVGLAALALLFWGLRIRRRVAAHRLTSRRTWEALVRELGKGGIRQDPSETVLEFGDRAARMTEVPIIRDCAASRSTQIYHPDHPALDEADHARIEEAITALELDRQGKNTVSTGG